MQVDPKESRQAHSQTGRLTLTAASSLSQQDSLIPCDLRGPQPVPCRGDGAGQPGKRFINAQRASEDRFLADVLPMELAPRPHRPIPPRILRRIYAEDQRFNDNSTATATNAEFFIYALGLITLIIGVAAVFA